VGLIPLKILFAVKVPPSKFFSLLSKIALKRKKAPEINPSGASLKYAESENTETII